MDADAIVWTLLLMWFLYYLGAMIMICFLPETEKQKESRLLREEMREGSRYSGGF